MNFCLAFASVVCVCLQEGFTAALKAALNGRLTVLRTLVEQYGGNVLHRTKVKWLHTYFLWCRHLRALGTVTCAMTVKVCGLCVMVDKSHLTQYAPVHAVSRSWGVSLYVQNQCKIHVTSQNKTLMILLCYQYWPNWSLTSTYVHRLIATLSILGELILNKYVCNRINSSWLQDVSASYISLYQLHTKLYKTRQMQ